MKPIPSWDDSPEWANYLAMDANGDWNWYEAMPHDRVQLAAKNWDISSSVVESRHDN